MLKVIENLPDHVFGVRAIGEVDKAEIEAVLLPGLQNLVNKYEEIYYLLVLETSVKNFTAGFWWEDMKAGIKHFTKWKKIAVVTDEKAVELISDAFSFGIPGEAKGYTKAEEVEAIGWVSVK